MATEFTPYSTAVPFHGSKPSWVPEELDQQRLLTYDAMEQIYWNAPDMFKVSFRGTNELPVYVPSGRTIVDTTHRYTAPGFAVVLSNRSGQGAETQDVIASRLAIADIMKRERFRSKFNGNKRYGLIRGDWIWHITADENKPIGTRISITALDPALYFPIPDENNVDRIIGCHLAEPVSTPDGQFIRRLTYTKEITPTSTIITVQDGLFEMDGWQSLEARPVEVIKQPTALPPTITALPVYHVRNFDEPGNPFGSSELRGLEALMGSINQVISDEDLALALDGIGVYFTDAPDPIDPDTKQRVPWRLGPGRVAHVPEGRQMGRLNGVGSVTPYGDHFDRLVRALRESSGTPDIAVGRVDPATVASGVALQLEMGPMLAKVGEKNDLIVDTHNQMFFDLINGWFPAYEQTTFTDVGVECVVGDAIPVDRERRFAELNDMLDRGVIDTQYYRAEAAKLGYTFPEDIGTRADAQYAARNEDQFAARAAGELGGDEE